MGGSTRRGRVRAVFTAAAVAAAVLVVALPGPVDAAPAGLVAAYAFDEGSGTTSADASGNGNTATLVNTTWTAAGKDGGALVFNGTNARVDVASNASLQLTTGMTLEAWVKPAVVSSSWRDVIYKAPDNFYLEGTSDRSGGVPVAGATIGGSAGEANGTAPLAAGSWTFLTETYDGSDVRLYVNGTLTSTTAKTGSIATSSNPLQIGGDSLYGQYFNGAIDDVRVYNTALTATQIQTDMTTAVGGGGGGDTQPPSAPGTLTATAAGSSQVNLSWGAATDNVGVTNYLVERCQGSGCTTFAQVATTPGTTYSDTGLAASTTYNYRVRATDAAGNLGPYGNTATATTSSGGGGGPPLVAAYGFEENSGTTTADASGNGNTGTLVNATWTTAGKFGNALSFNGTNARVDIPDSSSLHLTTGMTLEAWVNPTTVTSNWKDVIYKGNDNYYLEGTSDHSGASAGGGTFGGHNANAFGTSALAAGSWSYLAVTYDGSTLSLYVNGTLTGTAATSGSISTSTNALQIGGDSLFGQYFNGKIDEVRVYSGALTAAQIQTDMTTPVAGGGGDTQPPSAPGTLTATAVGSGQINLSWGAATDNVGVAGYRVDRCQGAGCSNFSHLVQLNGTGTSYTDNTVAASTTYSYQVRAFDAAGNIGPTGNVASATTGAATSPTLVAAYGFDEGSGTTTADVSGNGHVGTLVNATWTTSGKYGNALSFNGTNARVDIPDAASLHLSTGMTLEAWVNPSTVSSAWRDVIYKGNDNYYLEATSTLGGVPAGGGIIGGSYGEADGSAALASNTWSYLALTYDGSNVRLYVNGTLVATTPKTGTLATSTNPLQIGGDSFYSQFFNGLIDEVRVYSSALTASQIQTDMNTPLGVPTAPTGLNATAASSTEIDLSWGASTGPAGVAGYRVERCQGTNCSNFSQIAAPTGTSFQDTGVVANTAYSYRVRAVDLNGKLGPYSNVASAYTGLKVSPHGVALLPGATQPYTATPSGGGSVTVTWAVDGIAGGSATVGTINSNGLYTAPAAVGKHTITATAQGNGQVGSADAYTTNLPGVYTRSYDNMRDGLNAGETVLSPANVNSSTFGKLFSYPLDGVSYAAPLYVSNVSIPNQGTHEIVYVATEHDSIYAFDATGKVTTPFWKDSFINPANGVTTVPASDVGECCDIAPEIGISGTPVIDPATNTMYVVVKTKEVSGQTTNYVQRLHAIDLSTGAEKFGGPVTITATVPGTGLGSSGGQLPFNSLHENQHTALALVNGVVYFGFSSHGDIEPYHGWIFGYNASTLQRTMALCLTPNQEGAGVWMSGSGLASDSTGSLYFITGDGEFDVNTGGSDYGDSYVRMTPTGSIADYFSPSNTQAINSGNFDLGSGGALLLPDQPGAHPHEMVSAGKDGSIFLVDRDTMGHFNASTNTNIQTLSNIFPNGNPEPGNFTTPVYFNGKVYFGPLNDTIQAFSLTNGLLSTSPTLRSSETYPDRGASLAVSASSPTANGILWAVQRNGTTAGDLRAYDLTASGGGQLAEIYNSDQAGSRDTLAVAAKFVPPVIANGKVFVAGTDQLTVYGLLP